MDSLIFYVNTQKRVTAELYVEKAFSVQLSAFNRKEVIKLKLILKLKLSTSHLDFGFACPEQNISKIYFNIYLNKEF